MPSYFEMLRMADAPWFPEQSFGEILKSGGLLMIAALLALAISLVLLLLAFLGKDRKWVFGALIGAVLATGAGWAGSYSGYRDAARLVEATQATPLEAELVLAANIMQNNAVIPTGLAFGVVVLGLAPLPFLREKPPEATLS